MDVEMPDGTILEGVPDNLSKAEVMYRYNNSKIKGQQPESSPLNAAMVGAGSSLMSLGRGAQNLYGKATGNVDLQDRMAAQSAESSALMQPIEKQHPVATTIGKMLPGLATAPLSGGLLTQAGIGAALGSAEYGENQGAQGLVGGALSGIGYGAGKGLGRLFGKGTQAVDAGGEVGRLSSRANDIGMNVLPGQRTDSLPLKQFEAGLKSNPAVSGLLESGMKKNQGVINKLAAESIGETGEEIPGSMLGSAATRIGKVYDDVAKGVDSVKVDGLQDYYNNLSFDSIARIENYVKRFPGLKTGVLSGEDFMKLRQITQKDIRGAWKNLPSVAEDLQDFQILMLKGLEDAAPGAKAALKVANKQWRNLKALEAGKTVTKGNVNPRSLDTSLRRLDKGGYLRGRDSSDYYDAVRVANQFSDVVGDSGTATRSMIGMMLQDPKIGITAAAMRPGVKKYLKTGQGLLSGDVPLAGQTGAAIGRGGLLGLEDQ